MKRILALVFLCFLFTQTLIVNAQVGHGGVPPSFNYDLSASPVNTISVYPTDLQDIFQEDARNEKMGVVYRYGVSVPVNAGIDDAGTWTTLPDGKQIWRLAITSENAKAIGVNFDKFRLPVGSKLFVYNAAKDMILGYFDETNNPQCNEFAIQLIKGETAILEYVAPEYSRMGYLDKRNATEKERINLLVKPVIHISEICYAYRNVGFLTGDEKDSSCEVNINCPEGANWQNQKKGVARISVKEGSSYGWCTGSLVNNAAQDCTPYFLTADHCGGTASASDFNQWVFYFNYEASTCTGTTGSTSQSMTGCTFKARGPQSGGSDFLLLQLNASMPSNYNAYYNGWNIGTTASPSGVSIHHPAGLIKKISTYTTTLTSTTWSGGATNAHWLIYWAATQTNHGVTEGGSSGSPLFDNNKYMIGTLTGGSSYCSTPSQPDLYGKMSYHWISNGTASNRQLKPWLGPSYTQTTLAGTSTCGSNPGTLVCTNAINLTCGQTYTGTTVGGASNVSTYNCQTWSESGPEKVHKIVTTSTGTITATLSGMSVDLDVFILSSCSESACVGSGDNSASYASAPAGTYYIVVDGYSGASGAYTLNVTCSGGTTSTCDTITNVGSSESLTYYTMQGVWGYVPGHNGNNITAYADKYTNSGTKYIKYAWVPAAKAYAGSGSSSVNFKAWNGSGSTPGTLLGTKSFTISSFTVNQWKLIEFTSPIAVSGNFFFGFEINYSSTDTFAVYTAAHRAGGTNTAYMYYNGGWSDFATAFSGNLNTSLGIEPVLCTTVDIDENSELANKVVIFPNPANDLIAVDFTFFKSRIEEVVVYDVIGKVIENIDVNKLNENKAYISLDNYKAGLYFISVRSGNKTHVNKFTVIK